MLALPEINFKRTPATLIIMAVAVALEVVCTIDDLQGGGRRLAYCNDYLGILPLIWMGELWRPFTSTLMHGDLLHAGFNVYWLLIFGAALENHLGSYRTLGLIVLLGYVSMLPEYVIGSYHREQPIMIVGLSGIVYGLFGMLWIGRRWRPEFDAVCTPQTAQILLIWFFLCIVLTYTGHMMVANIAHGAGFIFGVLYGQAAFSPERRRRWIILAVASSLLVEPTSAVGRDHILSSNCFSKLASSAGLSLWTMCQTWSLGTLSLSSVVAARFQSRARDFPSARYNSVTRSPSRWIRMASWLR
jgi:membrane associated rhomboid family serine protease